MADEKEGAKTNPSDEFRKNLMNRSTVEATILEGLKSKSGRVRALAVKAAFKFQDHKFIKAHILGLIKSDKSKKVLRAIDDKITRKELTKQVKASRVKKVAGKKADGKKDEAPAAPAT